MRHGQTIPPQARPTRRAFTLVELLAAMAILVVMVFLLFRFIAGAQQAWSVSNASQEVYEKARIAMDVITRDLQSAVARSEDVPGYHIRFQQVDASTLRFVGRSLLGAEGTATESALSPLAEVGYRLDDYAFDRAILRSCSDIGCTWDLYRDRSAPLTSTPPNNYFNHGTDFQEVIDGVLGLRFVCYDQTLNPQAWLGTDIETALPFAVRVDLRIIDSKSFARWQLLNTTERSQLESEVALTFSKMIFLGGRQ